MIIPTDDFMKSTSGFMSVLYDAYCRADSGNRERIEKAFPHLFVVPLERRLLNALDAMVECFDLSDNPDHTEYMVWSNAKAVRNEAMKELA